VLELEEDLIEIIPNTNLENLQRKLKIVSKMFNKERNQYQLKHI